MEENKKKPELNPNLTLDDAIRELLGKGGWVKQNTAIIVVHGIGNQLPLETVDQFGRGLIKEYAKLYKPDDLTLNHVLFSKPSDNGNGYWFDNVVRIKL